MEYKKYNECKIGLFCVDNQNFGLGFSYWPWSIAKALSVSMIQLLRWRYSCIERL
jgi:hypothetical protein